MIKLELTKEQTEKVITEIEEATKKVGGTLNSYKYFMQFEHLEHRENYKTGEINKYWYSVGISIPEYNYQNEDVIIYKKIKDVEWLYYGEERYMLSKEVKNLFEERVRNLYTVLASTLSI